MQNPSPSSLFLNKNLLIGKNIPYGPPTYSANDRKKALISFPFLIAKKKIFYFFNIIIMLT